MSSPELLQKKTDVRGIVNATAKRHVNVVVLACAFAYFVHGAGAF